MIALFSLHFVSVPDPDAQLTLDLSNMPTTNTGVMMFTQTYPNGCKLEAVVTVEQDADNKFKVISVCRTLTQLDGSYTTTVCDE